MNGIRTPHTTFLTAASADFAEQIIEKVGPEVYRPIFMSGILLGFIGIGACALLAFVIAKFDLSEQLNRQFEEGKEAQLIPLSSEKDEKSPPWQAASGKNEKGNPQKSDQSLSEVVEDIDL